MDLTAGRRTHWGHLLAPTGGMRLGRTGPQPTVPAAGSASVSAALQPPGGPRLLSLGAGVQSTALLLLAAEHRIRPFHAAVFADTGWEPHEVYEHLDRLVTDVAEPAGIPVIRVAYGNLRDDSISEHYTTVLPLYMTGPDGSAGMLSRQCTQNYKLLPIYRYVRQLLGAPTATAICRGCDGRGSRVPPPAVGASGATAGECSICRGSGVQQRIGPVPPGSATVEMAIGFSVDEIRRVGPSRRPYVVHDYPLLDLGWTREDARGYLADRGFAGTPRSACIGCPYHSDAEWERLRERSPDEWQDAVRVDALIRDAPGSSGLRGQAYLHRQRVPLASINEGTYGEPTTLGCSPFGCRTEAGVDALLEDACLDEDERIAK